MKLVRLMHDGAPRWGLLDGNDILAIDGDPYSPDDQKARGGWLTTLDRAQLLAPAAPGKLLAVGRNYIKHIEEMAARAGANPLLPPRPDHPTFFLKPNSAIIGPNTPIVYPVQQTSRVEHEAELGLVIGRRAKRVSEADAMDIVAGYLCGNDVSARDLRDDGQWMRGKGFDTFAPLGPYLVTGIDASDLRIQARVNGVVKQDSRTSDLLFKLPQLISFISQAMTLEPGDVIITGTPSGVSEIHPGDVVEIEIEDIGVLRNPVVAG
ncbi:MAG: fumarylacetoacetate hydrolase family protein [Chloroflexi bacterium]|nr:fumarylacetoacetate hydrolase family protein [Chloroflexota bacterium]MBI3732122.1 fumarylacetoacetate hydrolase family protein [Chloroflexota bacterium]